MKTKCQKQRTGTIAPLLGVDGDHTQGLLGWCFEGSGWIPSALRPNRILRLDGPLEKAGQVSGLVLRKVAV